MSILQTFYLQTRQIVAKGNVDRISQQHSKHLTTVRASIVEETGVHVKIEQRCFCRQIFEDVLCEPCGQKPDFPWAEWPRPCGIRLQVCQARFMPDPKGEPLANYVVQ